MCCHYTRAVAGQTKNCTTDFFLFSVCLQQLTNTTCSGFKIKLYLPLSSRVPSFFVFFLRDENKICQYLDYPMKREADVAHSQSKNTQMKVEHNKKVKFILSFNGKLMPCLITIQSGF